MKGLNIATVVLSKCYLLEDVYERNLYLNRHFENAIQEGGELTLI